MNRKHSSPGRLELTPLMGSLLLILAAIGCGSVSTADVDAGAAGRGGVGGASGTTGGSAGTSSDAGRDSTSTDTASTAGAGGTTGSAGAGGGAGASGNGGTGGASCTPTVVDGITCSCITDVMWRAGCPGKICPPASNFQNCTAGGCGTMSCGTGRRCFNNSAAFSAEWGSANYVGCVIRYSTEPTVYDPFYCTGC